MTEINNRPKMTFSEAGKLGSLASLSIIRENKEKRIENYNKNPNKCKYCNENLNYYKKKNNYCSSSCSAAYNNEKRKTIKNCIYCNKNINSKKYCSRECQSKHNWKIKKAYFEKYNKWNDYSTDSGNCLSSYKKYILEKRGHQCEICKNTEWQNQKIPLILDHISGNSDDWNLENLRLVCGNCDMQLPTYKGKNIGNGRHNRRKRYKEGKSY